MHPFCARESVTRCAADALPAFQMSSTSRPRARQPPTRCVTPLCRAGEANTWMSRQHQRPKASANQFRRALAMNGKLHNLPRRPIDDACRAHFAPHYSQPCAKQPGNGAACCSLIRAILMVAMPVKMARARARARALPRTRALPRKAMASALRMTKARPTRLARPARPARLARLLQRQQRR